MERGSCPVEPIKVRKGAPTTHLKWDMVPVPLAQAPLFTFVVVVGFVLQVDFAVFALGCFSV